MLALKHGGRRDLADPLGRALGERLLARGVGAGTPVVPVPLAWLRRHERGHDQALGIARGVAESIGAPVVRALRRRRWTPPQGSAVAASRAANVAGAFVARRVVRRLSGLEVLLVDDVVTSGATLAECARVLRRAGVRRVRPAFVARAARIPAD
ncbi:MAG: ComF family protein [Planctomycetes bacterium]|nr:ComF family protein [Planctomycetota bacterium]